MVLISYEFALFFILAFVVDRVPFIEAIKEISNLGKHAITTINSATIEDSEKQKILLADSAGIFIRSLKIAVLALLILIGGYLLAFVGDEFNIVKISVLFRFFESIMGIVVSVLAFGSYFLIKKVYARARS